MGFSPRSVPASFSGDVGGGSGFQDSEFFVRLFHNEFDPDRSFRGPAEHLDMALVLTREVWGAGDDKLGETLLADLLVTLVERKQKPRFLILLNAAVKLAAGGQALESLRKLEALGVRILVNRTSLTHFGLEREVRVGEAVTMMDLVAQLLTVGKVLTL